MFGVLTLSLEILADCIVFDLQVPHGQVECLGGVVQSRGHQSWRQLAKTVKEHEAQNFDLVDIGQSGKDPVQESGKVDFDEAGRQL